MFFTFVRILLQPIVFTPKIFLGGEVGYKVSSFFKMTFVRKRDENILLKRNYLDVTHLYLRKAFLINEYFCSYYNARFQKS